MATQNLLSEPALRALAWLLDLAAQGAGFTVRGQPGWASADQIEAGVRGWGTGEMMRAQAARGRVFQHDARAVGEKRPAWVYRISQRGVEDLARSLGVSAVSVQESSSGEETGTLVRDSTQHALAGLRAALDPDAKPRREWVAGEVGWRSSRETTTAMAREDEAAGRSYRWFTTDDLRWLAQLGFVEKRVIGRTHIYRLTPAGAALKPLEWKELRHG